MVRQSVQQRLSARQTARDAILDLHRYELLKSELADLLRSVPWRSEQFERNRDLFARLAEDRFNLAVVGRFSRGKSTLMNAMLGMDRLPTGIEPLTSVITSVAYGSRERVVLHFRDTTLFQDIGLDELDRYVTEHGNPGNRRRIRGAEIQLPADLLRSGFRFIDTPGLGSPVVGNTAETRGFLPEADAFLLVTGFDGPLTEDEAEVLLSAAAAGRRVFVVLNKADLLNATERDGAIAVLRSRLHTLGLAHDQTLYPVSAGDALAARLRREPEQRLTGSGLPALERNVLAYLTESKRQAFLQTMCARLEAALADAPEPDEARRHLANLRQEIETGSSGSLDPDPWPHAAVAANLQDCLVCGRIEQATFDALTGLQGCLRRDPAARQALADQGGLCGPHTRQFAAHAAPREVCTGFAPVLDARAAALRAMADRASDAALHPADCTVCRRGRAVEETSLAEIGTALRSMDPAATVCLPHLDALARRLQAQPGMADLLRHQARVLERRADDMRRFALKQDAGLRDRISDEERQAAGRGLATLVGPFLR